MSQQSLESIYSNAGKVKTYEATESVMKPKVVSESHEKLKPMRNQSSKSGPAHTYEAGEEFMKYSAVIAQLSPRQFGEFVKLAAINEKAAKNWLHGVGDSMDSAGQAIYGAGKSVYDAGAAVNRGVRNMGNAAYNYGQSVARIPDQIYKGVTGGLGDQKDVMGSGNYGPTPPGRPTPNATMGPASPRIAPALPPRPATPPAAAPRPMTPPAAAPRPAAPPVAPPTPTPTPTPTPAAPAPAAGGPTANLSRTLGRPVANNPATGKPNLSWADEQKLKAMGR